MKKIFISIICVFVSVLAFGQKTVGYTYKPLSAEGCTVKFSVVHQEGVYYIITSVNSDRLVSNDLPILMLKTFKNEVIKLEGKSLSSTTASTGVMVGNIMVPVTEIKALAQFPIGKDQIEKLQDGVCKVRLSTLPLTHEREFDKDKIGKKLYKMFHNVLNSEDDF